MKNKPEDLYLAPKPSVHQRFYDMEVGDVITLDVSSRRATRIIAALHRNKLSLREHRRYAARAISNQIPYSSTITRMA